MSALHRAARQLAEVLERENQALQRFDLPRAASLLCIKQAAVATFEQCAHGASVDMSNTVMEAAAVRLRDVAAENKRLLERAIAAQHSIMSLLAHAARKSGQGTSYGARGAYVSRDTGGAFAISARA